jgi:signal transduction histidine kinase
MTDAAAAPPADVLDPTGFSSLLLNLSVSGVLLMRPRYEASGEIVDFDGVQLNPAAQQMLRLPECPAESFLTLYPTAKRAGIFDFYREAFRSDTVARRQNLYQLDGLDGYYLLVAQRYQDLLVVSFTDTNDQPRSAVEDALRASQVREQAAFAEAERQQALLHRVFEEAPAMICILQGPEHVFEFANASYRGLVGERPLLGRPFAEAFAELVGQGIMEPLQEVYRTGEPFYANEQLARIDHTNSNPADLEYRYYNLVWQARRDLAGAVDGVLVFAYDVTPQVRARQQVEQLNVELEARVEARTREAEAARAEAERQRTYLESVFHHAPAAIAVYGGPNLVFELVNPVYQALLPGRPLRGLPVRDAFPEVAELSVFDTLRQVYETGTTHYEQDQLILVSGPDGTLENRYFNFTLQARYDAQHRVDGVVGFGLEVTKQVVARQQADTLQAELLATAQHQAAERHAFYQIFEQTPALIALLRNPGHRFEYVNPAYQSLFPGCQLVGLDAVEAAPELLAQGFIALLDRVYQTGETHFGQETPFVPVPTSGQPARTTYFDFTYQAFRENGAVAGVSIFAFDVTEQVLIRQQREGERLRIERLFMEAPAAICILSGPELVYELVNPPYQALFPGRELLGKPILAALPEIADNPVYTTFRQVYETGQTHEEQALLIPLVRPADGVREDRYFKYIQQPRYAVDGRIDGVLVFAFEVTEQVRIRQQVQALNEELRDSNRQLTRTNVDLDTFVYTASHDLKAPITNIESIVLALRETLPPAVRQDEVVDHLLGLLDTTVARFQFTIGQLTDISRLQLAHTGPTEPVVLAPVVEAVRLDLAPVIAAAGTDLTVTVAPELVVSFSPANLRSIVYNLLSNAVKYHAGDRPSQVHLQAAQTPQAVVLTVQDNGLGMSEVQQRQLFGLFQRLHTHVEGTGVGLYITKRLVENAGGAIAVQSQPGVGTTFTVTFPA